MKRKLIAGGIGVVETGVGIVISAILGNLLWLGIILIVVGVITLILAFTWNRVVRCSKWFTTGIMIGLRVVIRMKDANRFLLIAKEQQNNRAKWLYPVVQHIDLNRQGAGASENDVFVKFAIDSALLKSAGEYYTWAKLILEDANDIAESDWCEITQEGRYPPLMAFRRYQFAESKIHITDNGLMIDMMRRFRDGKHNYEGNWHVPENPKQMLAKLQIGMKFKRGDSIELLEGATYVAPMNDYRGD